MQIHKYFSLLWLSTFILVLQFRHSHSEGFSDENKSFENIHKGLELSNLQGHFRYIDLANKPNTAALVRVTGSSNCFNRTILQTSANLVRISGISKENAASFLANHPNASTFCNAAVTAGCNRTLAGTIIRCNATYPYRTINGTCNNLQKPLLGAAERPFNRFLPPDYEDGVTLPRGFNRVTNPLPNPRQVSNAMVSLPPLFGSIYTTLLMMQWGQFMDHDLIRTPESATLSTVGPVTIVPIACCEKNDQTAGSGNPDCLPISVQGDVFFSPFGVNCLKFVRSLPTTATCKLGPREQVNLLTNFVDASQIYGSSVEEEAIIRAHSSGRLLTGDFRESSSCPGQQPFSNLPEFRAPNGRFVSFAGDERVLEQPGLTSVHALFLRIHNGIAAKFQAKYPTMTDEQKFQETRRIVGALLQSITYGEFLPIVLGQQKMDQSGLSLLSTGYTSNYNPNVDPTTPNAFGIAFRFGHSLVSDVYSLPNKQVLLAESFVNNDVLKQVGSEASDFLQGMSISNSEQLDHVLVKTLTNQLLASAPFTNGSDLYSLNVMRGRDHGLPGYNDWRQFCGLPRISTFIELAVYGVMRPTAVIALSRVYKKVSDIDLFPGGLSEFPADGALLGPTLSCILSKHFSNIKIGDRFWFESSTQPKIFTPGQLNAIRNTKISALICQFSTATQIQPAAMLSTFLPGNGLQNCSQFRSPILEQFNTLW